MRKRAQRISKARSISDAAENLENPTRIEAEPAPIDQKTGAFAVGDAEQDGKNEQSEKAELEAKLEKCADILLINRDFLKDY